METAAMAARYRLISLWICQVARSLADTVLRSFIVLRLLQLGVQDQSVWAPIIVVFAAPFILLSPISGTLMNSLPTRSLLAGTAAFCFCVTVVFGAAGVDAPWFWYMSLGLLGAGQAIYSPARYGLLPSAAQDARLPLNRVTGWINMGCAAGMVGGLAVGFHLRSATWSDILASSEWGSSPVLRHFPAAAGAALACDLIAVLAALPVCFVPDLHRPESAVHAVGDSLADCQTITEDRVATRSLVGLAFYLGTFGAAIATVLASAPGTFFDSSQETISQPLLFASAGAVGGCLLAAVQGHPRRMLGLVPPAALGVAAALAWVTTDSTSPWAWFLVGFLGAIVTVPLLTSFQLALPPQARGNGLALMNGATALSVGGLSFLVLGLGRLDLPTPAGQFGVLAALAAGGAVLAWRLLLREVIEQLGEIILWPMYRIQAHGPGRGQIPLCGPLLVIANHTAWFDPLWLAKVLPRRLTAMMTSRFFDLPILHWLMRNVAGTIRVPAVPFRREAPELQEAVAVLDRGGCVLIFPEGAMKRSSENFLRHFGQGVWRILQQRPTTPVVVCWIEGGWGSFTSYDGGPPTVNKHLDWRRQIDIAVDTPHVLDAALLADHRATRRYLQGACLDARHYLEGGE